MKKIIALGTGFFLSSFTFAQAALTSGSGSGAITTGATDVNKLAEQIKSYFNLAIEMMIAAAFVWVVWNAFNFVLSAGDEEKRTTSRTGIVYGIIGIVVMLSVWGLVGIVTKSTGLTSTTPGTTLPSVN